MTLPTVFLIAVALGTDAFSMAVCIGLSGITKRKILFISFLIALFHIFMPLIGLLLGSWLGKAVGQLATFIGAIVLIFIGLQMLREGIGSQSTIACKPAQSNIPMQVYSGLVGMLALSCSVSLDALTVGFGLGTLQVNLALTVIIMGVVAGLMTLAGFLLGIKIGARLGKKAEILGGIILIIIGVKMFF
jgi:putative Mn2+ efflux pump MntP